MKMFLMLIASNICSLAAIAGATVAAVYRVDGWGWFLLVAVVVGKTLEWKE